MAVEQQMEMAFMEERPTVDPVSGNEVPPGSLPEEVRDDIDARLSEGEYVVPADVVRYFGVKFFEDLRTEAKSGLGEMEADGRIGGEPVDADMLDMDDEDDMDPDSIPTIEDDGTEDNSEGMYRGGMVGIGMEGYTAPPTQNQGLVDQVQTQAMQSPATMQDLSSMTINNNTTMANTAPQDMMAENRDKADEVRRFAEGGSVTANTDTQTQNAFSYGSYMPSNYSAIGSNFNPYNYPLGFSLMGSTGAREVKQYYDPKTGTTTLIPHDLLTGMPLYPPPAGFVLGTPTDVPATPEAPEAPQAPVASSDDGPNVDMQKYYDIDKGPEFDPTTGTLEDYQAQLEKIGKTQAGKGVAAGIAGMGPFGILGAVGMNKLITNNTTKQLEAMKSALSARTDMDESEKKLALAEINELIKNPKTFKDLFVGVGESSIKSFFEGALEEPEEFKYESIVPNLMGRVKGQSKWLGSEKEAFAAAVRNGDENVVAHYEAINRLREKQNMYADLKAKSPQEARAFALSSGLSEHDIAQADRFDGSLARAIIEGRTKKPEGSNIFTPYPEATKRTTKPIGNQPVNKNDDDGPTHDEIMREHQAIRDAAAAKVAKTEGTDDRTDSSGKETYSSKVKRGGGFAKGGLMKKKKK